MTELRLFTAFGMRGMRRLQSLGDQKQFRFSLAPPPLGERRENRSTQAERAAEGGGQCARPAELHSLSAPCAFVLLLEGAFVFNGERNAVKVAEICNLCCSALLHFLVKFLDVTLT